MHIWPCFVWSDFTILPTANRIRDGYLIQRQTTYWLARSPWSGQARKLCSIVIDWGMAKPIRSFFLEKYKLMLVGSVRRYRSKDRVLSDYNDKYKSGDQWIHIQKQQWKHLISRTLLYPEYLPVLTVFMISVKSAYMSWLPYFHPYPHNNPLLPMQSQCVLTEFMIKWVTQTNNEVIIIKCNKCKHGGSPGGCESTKEAPESAPS